LRLSFEARHTIAEKALMPNQSNDGVARRNFERVGGICELATGNADVV
jgi:hypothetical protein